MDRLNNLNFVCQDRQLGFRRNNMLRQLLRAIGARDATQDKAAIVEQESEIANKSAQSCLHPIFQISKSAPRFGWQGFRGSVVVHGFSLLRPLRANDVVVAQIQSGDAGGCP